MYVQIAVFILLGCISGSWQRCFDNHCAHHSPLTSCISGAYLCQADEFCETVTHVPHNSHSNSPWVHTICRPDAEMQDCLALQSSNHPDCDPNKHDIICHFCCDSEQCVKDLAMGIHPTMPPTTAMPATTTTAPPATPVPTATTAAGGSGGGGMVTNTIPPDVTTTAAGGTTKTCVDMYIGDCSTDFAGRCSEPLIQQLCALTCKAC